MTSAPDPRWLAEAVARTDARLTALFAAKREAASATSPEAAALVDALRALTMRGAKRLRAAALHAGFCAVRGTGEHEALTADPCAALELLQSYFLIQDDWMDGDQERRGGPAVHAALSAKHGDAQLGASLAILASDLASGFAWELMAGAPFPPSRSAAALHAFGAMHFEVVCGQQLDLLGHRDVALVHRLKTGSYTVRGPLRLGALLGAASETQLAALERFGEPLGLAFQLRDDLLGVFGSAGTLGKPVGNDLRAGKHTSLIAEAQSSLSTHDAAILDAVLGNAHATDAQVEAVKVALVSSGAQDRVQARIVTLLAEALAALDQAPLDADGRARLRSLAERLVTREK